MSWTPVFWIGGALVLATIAGLLIRGHNKGKNKSKTPAAAAA